MPNGRPGDHPYTDILIHGRTVYSPRVDSLVREVAALSSEAEQRRLSDMLFSEFNEFSSPNVAELERRLTELRNLLVAQAKSRGWEVP